MMNVKTLNITNGDSAVGIMQQAGIAGEFLPWRDILHDGPVPQSLSLEALTDVRAKFIVSQGWGTPENINASFIERDNTLKSSDSYDEVVLWFEHDLYDQLQLLQILDWFNRNRLHKAQCSIICVDQYLGTLSPAQMSELCQYKEPITEEHLSLASLAWSAFCSDTPQPWFEMLSTERLTAESSVLPFLKGAVLRQLEEYPNCRNGLSRIGNQTLQIISQGVSKPWEIFTANQESEERQFLGDSSFWLILHAFLKGPEPLLMLGDGQYWVSDSKALPQPDKDFEFTITPIGKAVLAGDKNWLDMVKIDRWIGGVHLIPSNLWCYDSVTNSIEKKFCH